MASPRDQENFLNQLMATMGILPSLETEKVSSLQYKKVLLLKLSLLLLLLFLLLLLLFLNYNYNVIAIIIITITLQPSP